jgi:hypothetical protein
MLAAIYARKSTDQNLPDAEKSVTRQVEHATAYARRKGWTVDPAHVYTDDAVSGAEFVNRPGLSRLLAALSARPLFDALILAEPLTHDPRAVTSRNRGDPHEAPDHSLPLPRGPRCAVRGRAQEPLEPSLVRRTLHQREGFLKIEHAEGNGQPAFTDEATQGGLVSFSEPILPLLEVGKDLRVEVAEHGRQPASVKTHSLCHSTRRRGVRGVIIACSAPAASRRALST